jgi:23S rRNA (uracil1939-C5)-methyltransferase
MLLRPIEGPAWGYRHRARLSVRHVAKKGGVLVGFHERRSSYVADMRECHVLPRKISDLLPAMRSLVEGLTIRDRVPQIEVAIGERPGGARDASGETEPIHALVFRVLEPPTADDEARLRAFANLHGIDVWLQRGGPATATPLHPPDSRLAYTLPEFDVVLPFGPTEFTQVNPHINRVLVRRAVALLDPRPGERIGDFFCGLGNFALPIARRGAHVVGVEGAATLVERARENAACNGLADRVALAVADLFAATPESIDPLLPLDKALIDPPREGAVELAKALPQRDDERSLERIVYVSCNPATLARDAAVLVHERGYALDAAGVVNMFPHTAHVESIALFTR